LLPLVVGHLFVLLPSACRAVNLPVRKWIGLTLQPAVVAIILATAAGIMVRAALPPDSTRMVLVQGVLVGLLYLAAVLVFGLTREMRTRYLVEIRAAWVTFRRWLAPAPPASAEL
jgi:hypothetical protein